MLVSNKPFINIQNKDQTKVPFKAKDPKPACDLCSSSPRQGYDNLLSKYNALKEKIKAEPDNDELVIEKVKLAAELLQEAKKIPMFEGTMPLLKSIMRLKGARKDLYKVNERRYNEFFSKPSDEQGFYTAKFNAAKKLLNIAERIGSSRLIHNSRKRFEDAEREWVAANMKASLAAYNEGKNVNNTPEV